MKNALTSAQAEKFGDKLYQRYGKPLEKDHWGKFMAVSQRGKTILGESLLDVAQKAVKLLGPGNFIFRVGEKSVGRLRHL